MSSSLPSENIFGHTLKLRFILSELDRMRNEKKQSLRILDLGCGSGMAVTQYLAREGDELLGIDMYEPNISYAKKNFSTKGTSFLCTSIEDIQDDGISWDVVVLADVLEHLEDPSGILSACGKLLTAEGYLLVSVPNGNGLFEIESAISRLQGIGPLTLKMLVLFVAFLNKLVFRGLWSRGMDLVPKDIPYNDESPHLQFKSYSGWLSLLDHCGYRLVDKRNLAFMSGPYSNTLLGFNRLFCRLNLLLASKLPSSAVSNWVFSFKKNSN